ncbi:MAG TPA: metallophosphoesterase family protein [Candidatus Hydrogenedentes bacterium]|nr:metallophosphoesterase family protein [Candidatus Hydrogenedentota bacterium]
MNISIRAVRGAAIAIAALIALAAYAEPKQIYLTYSGAPENSIDINIIQREKVPSVEVHFDTAAKGTDPAAYANHIVAEYKQTVMEICDRRALYVARLTGLKPGTVYHFIAGEAKYGMSKERKFRTLPGGDKPIRFVNGGDMGADGKLIPLLTLAGKEDPDFGLIGGDLAYENGLLGNFATWDKWLDSWDQLMVTTDGRMVPMVTAIGNHEVNRYAGEDQEMRSPWYIGYFGRQADSIYYKRQFGDNLVVFFLDSGHLTPHEGKQTEWLKAEMANHANTKYKFAAYHVPLYPAHRDYEGTGSVLGRTHWLPVFDEFGLTLGLEHHDHVFKRTKRLKGNEVVKKGGTVFIGDGCFGRGTRTIDPQPRWYNEKEMTEEHFWVVDVAKRGIKLKAVNEDGKVIDKFAL